MTGTEEEQENSAPSVNGASDKQPPNTQGPPSETTEDEQAASSIAESQNSQVKATVARATRMPKAPSYSKPRKAGVASEKKEEAEEEEGAVKEVPFQDDPSDADYTPS